MERNKKEQNKVTRRGLTTSQKTARARTRESLSRGGEVSTRMSLTCRLLYVDTGARGFFSLRVLLERDPLVSALFRFFKRVRVVSLIVTSSLGTARMHSSVLRGNFLSRVSSGTPTDEAPFLGWFSTAVENFGTVSLANLPNLHPDLGVLDVTVASHLLFADLVPSPPFERLFLRVRSLPYWFELLLDCSDDVRKIFTSYSHPEWGLSYWFSSDVFKRQYSRLPRDRSDHTGRVGLVSPIFYYAWEEAAVLQTSPEGSHDYERVYASVHASADIPYQYGRTLPSARMDLSADTAPLTLQ